MTKPSYIFDSFTLLKLFQKEDRYLQVVQLLKDIESSSAIKYISAINIGEIIYITKREFGDQKKIEALANIERLGLRHNTVFPMRIVLFLHLLLSMRQP